MNKIRIFLLLVLSLMTGSEATRSCTDTWTELICNHTKTTGEDERKNDMFFVFSDGKNKNIMMVETIMILSPNYTGQHPCKSNSDKSAKHTVDIKAGEHSCQKRFHEAANTIAKTCDYPNTYNKSDILFCKEKHGICEAILSKSSPRSYGTFNLTNTGKDLMISINTMSQFAGKYTCEVKNLKLKTKIQLNFSKIRTFKRSVVVGENVTNWCYDPNNHPNRFICKGEDPSTCQHLVNMTGPNMNGGKFVMTDKKKGNVTIMVRNVTTNDTGTYWCGAKSTDAQQTALLYRMNMTVEPPVSTDAPAADSQGLVITMSVITCVAVLLLLVQFVICVYKRFSRSKDTRDGAAAQQSREDYIYEEILEHPQNTDTGKTVSTIYSTVNFTINPSPPLCYSTINFPKDNGKADGEAHIVKISSSSCEYSAVRSIQNPTYSTVSQSYTSTEEDPLYSTVNKPQQQMSPGRKIYN